MRPVFHTQSISIMYWGAENETLSLLSIFMSSLHFPLTGVLMLEVDTKSLLPVRAGLCGVGCVDVWPSECESVTSARV